MDAERGDFSVSPSTVLRDAGLVDRVSLARFYRRHCWPCAVALFVALLPPEAWLRHAASGWFGIPCQPWVRTLAHAVDQIIRLLA